MAALSVCCKPPVLLLLSPFSASIILIDVMLKSSASALIRLNLCICFVVAVRNESLHKDNIKLHYSGTETWDFKNIC